MLDFKIVETPEGAYLETSITGKLLLTTPQLNKGTAFTSKERLQLNLMGKLPPRVESLEEQVNRAYWQYASYPDDFQRNIYLNNLHDKNQVLFYKLVSLHISEMMPLIYTPIVGTAVKKFSQEFRQPRGLYLAYKDKNLIHNILENRSNPNIELIVVTDGEGVLGLGDQGVGSMDIPVAKLMVYTLCGGINPCKTLPLCLDVGTNNRKLLEDPLYLGLKQKRVEGKDYDEFIDLFMQSIQKKFPNSFIHWEDFGRANAQKILDKYQNKICSFNDDIQGTGVVALASILAAVNCKQEKMDAQRFLIYGAGTAGMGITDQICSALINYFDMPEKKARQAFWLIDKNGLITDDQENLTLRQKDYARSKNEYPTTQTNTLNFVEIIHHIQPTVLIGCSGQTGAFDESAIKAMYSHVKQPIILPLSNPTECAEARPADLIEWTEGNALLATGSPFKPVHYQQRMIYIAQCNNALAFPGIGLGITAVKATCLNEAMIWAATKTLSQLAPVLDNALEQPAPLLPDILQAQSIAKAIAIAIAKQAIQDQLSDYPIETDLKKLIDEKFWLPCYLPFQLKKT